MADTDVLTRPSPEETKAGTTDKAEVSHYVKDTDWFRGYVTGQEIQALCGIWWVPFRDPKGLPICAACQEIYNALEG